MSAYQWSALKKAFLITILAIAPGCGAMGKAYEGQPLLSSSEHLRLGSIYESKKEYGPALVEYEKACLADRKNAKAFFALGTILLRKNDFDRAARNLDRAIRLKPDEPLFYNNLAWAYIGTDHLDKAQEIIEKALAFEDKQLKRHVFLDTLGAIHMKKGDLLPAEKAFKEAASLAPEDDFSGRKAIYENLLAVLEQKGDTDGASEARSMLERLNDSR